MYFDKVIISTIFYKFPFYDSVWYAAGDKAYHLRYNRPYLEQNI